MILKNLYKNEWMKFKRHYSVSFFVILVLSLLFLALFYLLLVNNPNQTVDAMKMIIEMFEQKGMSEVESVNTSDGNIETNYSIFLFVLKNNLFASFLIILFAFLSFVLVPPVLCAFTAIVNFSVLSIVLAFSKINGEDPLHLSITGILPHGLTEFFAILLCSAIGTFLSLSIFKFYWTLILRYLLEKDVSVKGSFNALKKAFFESFKTFLVIIFPFILLSALIEDFITPLFLS